MKWFTKLVGRLPFAGKMSIRPLVFGLYHSTTAIERRNSYLRILRLLAFFVLLHAVQTEMGIQALGFDSPIYAKAISGLYVLANVLVILTQLHLVFRTTRFFFSGLYPRSKRGYVGYSGAEMAIMLAVTIGGQIVFLSLYILYR
jgi:hypothetical protein